MFWPQHLGCLDQNTSRLESSIKNVYHHLNYHSFGFFLGRPKILVISYCEHGELQGQLKKRAANGFAFDRQTKYVILRDTTSCECPARPVFEVANTRQYMWRVPVLILIGFSYLRGVRAGTGSAKKSQTGWCIFQRGNSYTVTWRRGTCCWPPGWSLKWPISG